MALFDFLKKKKEQTRSDESKARAQDAKKEKKEKASEISESEPSEASHVSVSAESVLRSPHITERARMISEHGHYTFKVTKEASKREVKESVERMYSVHVESVRMVKAHEKKRRRGLTEGTKKGYKKAVVALRNGEAIDIF